MNSINDVLEAVYAMYPLLSIAWFSAVTLTIGIVIVRVVVRVTRKGVGMDGTFGT